MKVFELFEEAVAKGKSLEEGIEPVDPSGNIGARELYSELADILKKNADELKSHGQADRSYSISPTMGQVSSGAVKLVSGYYQHHDYGYRTRWDLCLQIGNNISGYKSGLEPSKKVFAELKSEAQGFDPKKFESHGEVASAYFDDGSVSMMFSYGSAYCTVCVRFDKA